MQAQTAARLLDETLGKIPDQATAEAIRLPGEGDELTVWAWWWSYGQYLPLTQHLAARVPSAVPEPIELVATTAGNGVDQALRVAGRSIADANIQPLIDVTRVDATTEAIHRTMTVSVFRQYADALREVSAPGLMGKSDADRLRRRAGVADQAADRAEAALLAIPDYWAGELRQLKRALDQESGRVIVTPVPKRKESKWHSMEP